MEPDRNPAESHDEIDDSQLLAAIERAWPVPPMTGHLIGRDWTSVAIVPQAGSFSAPMPLPRFQPRRTWSSFTRVAAVLALLLTSAIGVIAFNNRSDENTPSFSIAAPSPYESTCSLPLRSRDEIVELVTDVKAKVATGEEDGVLPTPAISIFDLRESDPEVKASMQDLNDDINDCLQSGTNLFALKMISTNVLVSVVAERLNQTNQSVDEVLNDLLPSIDSSATPTTDYQWEIPELKTYITRDGNVFAVDSSDIFGNGSGVIFQQDGENWELTGYATLQGDWSTLVVASTDWTSGCSSTSMYTEETMKQYLFNLGWNENALPLVTTLSSTRLGNPEVAQSDAAAITTVIDNYRDCIGAGIEPYRFAQGSEAFFGIFASYVHAIPSSSVDLLGLLSPANLVGAIPSAVTSIVSIDTDKALAVLAVNPAWVDSGKLPAIILVNVDGQWLINQLAIVQSPS